MIEKDKHYSFFMFDFQKDNGLEIIKGLVEGDKNLSRIYGFILYTDCNPYVAKVLRDNDFWKALDSISGNNWPIFAARPLQQGQMEIAMEMHHKYLDGEDKSDLLRDLNEMVTKGEIKVGDELEETRGKLYESDKEKQRLESNNKRAIKALENTIRSQVTGEYDKETNRLVKKYRWNIPLFVSFGIFALLLCLMFGVLGTSVIASFLVSAAAGIVTGIGFNIYANRTVITKRKAERDYFIEHETDFRLHKQLE